MPAENKQRFPQHPLYLFRVNERFTSSQNFAKKPPWYCRTAIAQRRLVFARVPQANVASQMQR
jgi:hypothetical protein